ncbi:MAG: hypothetical protein F6J89_03515 [Symploca sp. SIO1C4]|uniref:ABC transmembrane type-1 domain-containing protein n=1 Tax=Symploca sp. SIO1C4 TaxID=2607765 RepID=A0A6B3N9E3_9CYAN|nr:hypothetical protein [Symploca sp. SIO1C4]
MPTQIFSSQSSSDNSSDFTRFWENVKAFTGPYWYPTQPVERAFSEVIRAWRMLTFLILLIIALVGTKVFNSLISCFLIDSLIETKNYSVFINNLLLNIIGFAVAALLVGFSKFIREQIALDWYKCMNNRISDQYLINCAYDKVDCRTDVDNYVRHLLQEIEPIISSTLRFLASCLEKILEMGTFLIISWIISPKITVIILIYNILGNLITAHLDQQLLKVNQEKTKSKDDYIYYLIHFRNHTKSMFFIPKESQESSLMQHKFNDLINNIQRKINWEKGKNIFIKGYESIVQVLPFILLSPMFIEGGIDIGQLLLAALACIIFTKALGELISEFSIWGGFSRYAERLSEFFQALEEVTQKSENVTIGLLEPTTAAELTTIQVNKITPDIVEESNILPIDDN